MVPCMHFLKKNVYSPPLLNIPIMYIIPTATLVAIPAKISPRIKNKKKYPILKSESTAWKSLYASAFFGKCLL
jgi:hypothetical protein